MRGILDGMIGALVVLVLAAVALHQSGYLAGGATCEPKVMDVWLEIAPANKKELKAEIDQVIVPGGCITAVKLNKILSDMLKVQ